MDKEFQIQAWSKLYGRQITEEEYREICDNLKGFFDLLHKWDKEPNKKDSVSEFLKKGRVFT